LVLAAGLAQAQSPLQGWNVDPNSAATRRVEVAVEGDWVTPPLPQSGSCTTVAPLSRTTGARLIDWRFQLQEGEESFCELQWQGEQEGYRLSIRFHPLQGIYWTLTVDLPTGPLRYETREIDEPEDLRYHVQLRLPAEGGLLGRLDDGTPLGITVLGSAEHGVLRIHRQGAIQGIQVATSVQTLQTLPQDRARAELLQRARDLRQGSPFTARRVLDFDRVFDAWQAPQRSLPEFQEELASLLWAALGRYVAQAPEPRFDLLAEEEFFDLRVERLLIKPRERVEIPAFLLHPPGVEGSAPCVVYLCAPTAAGQLDPGVLQRAFALAHAGFAVCLFEPFGAGERRLFEPHDGPHLWEATLAGVTPAAVMVRECRAVLHYLRSRGDVDADRCALFGEQAAAWHAGIVAQLDPAVRCVAAWEPCSPLQKATAPPATLHQQLLATLPTLHGHWHPGWVLTALQPRALWLRPDPEDPLELPALPTTPKVRAPALQSNADFDSLLRFLHEQLDAPPSPTSLAVVEIDRETLQALRFGEEYLADIWYSWLLADARHQADRRPPASQTVAERLADLRPRPEVESCLVAEHKIDLEAGEASLFQIAATSVAPTQALWLVPPTATAETPVRIVASDFGKWEALEQSEAHLGAGVCLLALDLPGVAPPTEDLASRAGVGLMLGEPLLQHWLQLLRTALQSLPEAAEPSRPLELFGQGSAGILMTLFAVLEPERITRVTTLNTLPTGPSLLDRKARKGLVRSRNRVLSEGPVSSYLLPHLLHDTAIEDWVLALHERGIAWQWLEPVDQRFRPLSRRDRLALWPRIQHELWSRPP
jgi:dienelactone hydrolase